MIRDGEFSDPLQGIPVIIYLRGTIQDKVPIATFKPAFPHIGSDSQPTVDIRSTAAISALA
jgi:hypothetical protein